jgi:triosephosphate isomerase (TIM)
MGRKKIVAGNWKMNTSLAEAADLVKQVLASETNPQVSKIFFPPFPYLKTVSELTSGKPGFFCGAQNCSEHEKGAHTGEVSASMLSSVNCRYVLVGHSERRTYFKEDHSQLVLKIEQALKNNLIPVFCFGEQLADRKNNKHFETVSTQLAEVLKNFSGEQVCNFILAYEPVWAIGTGETATPAQAQEMHKFVRECLADLFNSQPVTEIPILYGGSCNAQNAPDLFACADVDGGLIGGASLKAADFCKIINSF